MLRPVDTQTSYLKHITDFSKDHDVVICDDVCNEYGVVIIAKGESFRPECTDKIAHHTLQVPFEECIKLNHYLDSATLQYLYQKVFKKHKDFNRFHEYWELERPLAKACAFYQQFPLLVQKVTILKSAMPSLFVQALYSAYISLAIAKQLGAPQKECNGAFLAGLVHDIGLLHLDESLVTTSGDYTQQQWQAMQRHTVIGHDVLASIKNMPSIIARAVLEHHERIDGSGYPSSKKADDLSVIGQIVGIADTCVALYQREILGTKLSIEALLPLLQLNADLYPRKIFHATVTLLSDIEWPNQRAYRNDEMPALMSRLKLENEWIQHDYSVLYGLVASVRPHLKASKRSALLINMAQRIHLCLVGSGVLQKEHSQWMLSSFESNSQDDFIAMEQLVVMYGEIKWQIQQLKELLSVLWTSQKYNHPQLDILVRRGLMQIEEYHQHHTEPELH